MGWRFRRSIRIVPGVRINLGKRGLSSVSVGGKGATFNAGRRGSMTTFSLPGTGLSYQHRFRKRPKKLPTRGAVPYPQRILGSTNVKVASHRIGPAGFYIIVAVGAAILFLLLRALP